MTQEETLEYNKRCVEFLDWSNYQEVFYTIPSSLQEHTGFIQNIPVEGLVFESNWNWIHEVIDAIIETYNKSHYITSKINYSLSKNCLNKNYRCEISIDDRFMKNVTIYTENLDKKEAVVQAINQFLIWYNEQYI